MKNTKYQVDVKLELELIDIEGLIVSAIEGGSNDWYRIETSTKGDYVKQAFTKTGYVISDYDGVGGDESKMQTGVLNAASIRKGLKLMAKYYPRFFADVVTGNADAGIGDVFLQLAVLGEVRYG